MRWLALDIGGANLKAADGKGFALSHPFPLWKSPGELASAIERLIAESPPAEGLVATMTGELADCFATKADGVRHIVDSLVSAAGGRSVGVYLLTGRIGSPAEAIAAPRLAAASNWHVLANFAGQFAPRGSALLLDIGSTTGDIIPLVDGKSTTQGMTDTERLLSGELVYTGVERSPICAITQKMRWKDRECPVAQELFATSWDVYLRLGLVPEEPNSTHTADGRPATREFARDRLARLICADRDTFDDQDADRAASDIMERQIAQIQAMVEQVIDRQPVAPQAWILSGQGEFLGREVVRRLTADRSQPIISLTELLGERLSRCAPAHALACLAAQGGFGKSA